MEGVTKKSSELPGKTVAIFGGVHGNERVGVEAVQWAVENVAPTSGTVYYVEANPPAIAQNVRMLEKNLNRRFVKGNDGTASEDVRARELMTLLDTCDALLDVHSSNSKDAPAFAICEEEALPIASMLDFDIVSTGWDAIEPGSTDGYMHRNGKIGLCIECGSAFDAERNLPRAKDSVLRFLAYFGLIEPQEIRAPAPQQRIHAYKAVHKETDAFSFVRDFKDFEPLTTGETFATDGETVYVAQPGDRIIFPRPNTAIGAEAFILGKEVAR